MGRQALSGHPERRAGLLAARVPGPTTRSLRSIRRSTGDQATYQKRAPPIAPPRPAQPSPRQARWSWRAVWKGRGRASGVRTGIGPPDLPQELPRKTRAVPAARMDGAAPAPPKGRRSLLTTARRRRDAARDRRSVPLVQARALALPRQSLEAQRSLEPSAGRCSPPGRARRNPRETKLAVRSEVALRRRGDAATVVRPAVPRSAARRERSSRLRPCSPARRARHAPPRSGARRTAPDPRRESSRGQVRCAGMAGRAAVGPRGRCRFPGRRPR